eukprot:6419317-Prymnesium_polylepis.1
MAFAAASDDLTQRVHDLLEQDTSSARVLRESADGRVSCKPPALPLIRVESATAADMTTAPATTQQTQQRLESEFRDCLHDCARLRAEADSVATSAARRSKRQAERLRLASLSHTAKEILGQPKSARGGLPERNLAAHAQKAIGVMDALAGASHAAEGEDYLARPLLEAAVASLAPMTTEGVARLDALNLLAELVARDGDKQKALVLLDAAVDLYPTLGAARHKLREPHRLETAHTRSTFLLAQTCAALGRRDASAAYCHRTLQRMLVARRPPTERAAAADPPAEPAPFDAALWISNARSLARYYQAAAQYLLAEHTVAAAEAVLDELERDAAHDAGTCAPAAAALPQQRATVQLMRAELWLSLLRQVAEAVARAGGVGAGVTGTPDGRETARCAEVTTVEQSLRFERLAVPPPCWQFVAAGARLEAALSLEQACFVATLCEAGAERAAAWVGAAARTDGETEAPAVERDAHECLRELAAVWPALTRAWAEGVWDGETGCSGVVEQDGTTLEDVRDVVAPDVVAANGRLGAIARPRVDDIRLDEVEDAEDAVDVLEREYAEREAAADEAIEAELGL